MWRLILLGDLALQRDGVEVRRLPAQKYAHLLAYLALWPHRAHSRSELLEIFWPDEPVENAQNVPSNRSGRSQTPARLH